MGAVRKLTLKQLDKLVLKYGWHSSRSKGVCINEAVSWYKGEKHSDQPECMDPAIAAFTMRWNDDLPSDAERTRLLKPLIPLLVNTRTTEADTLRRSQMAMDWYVRTCLPAWMELTESLKPTAAELRALPEIVSAETLTHAVPLLAKAQQESYAAWAAARAAAGDAARAAAGDAAWDAARAAAWAAAWDAAWAAAWDAAWAAARDAAGVAASKQLEKTKQSLQESAQDIVRRMCQVGR